MKEKDMETVVSLIDKVLMNIDNETVITSVKGEVKDLMQQFPLY
jgi:glycine hydroxymethyltransferase